MAKQFEPPNIAILDYRLLSRPLKSSERRVLLSTDPSLELGTLVITDTNACTWTSEPTEAAQLAAGPSHLCVMVDGALPNTVSNVVFTLTGTDPGNSVISATGTFAVPAYSRNQKKSFPRCWAVSFDQSAGTKFKTITSVSVVSNAGATGGRFKVFALPDISSFQLVGCIGSTNFTPRGIVPFAMRCGDDPQAFVVEGDVAEARLAIDAKFFNSTEGLSRLNGLRCVVMIEDLRARRVVTGRYFCTGYYPTPGERGSEGPEAVTNDSEAPVEETLSFTPGPYS
jgi:hypothetical protein